MTFSPRISSLLCGLCPLLHSPLSPTHTHTHVYTHTHTHTCVHTHAHTHTVWCWPLTDSAAPVDPHMGAGMHTHTHTHTHTHARTHTHTHTHTHMHVHIHTHTHARTHTHIHILPSELLALSLQANKASRLALVGGPHGEDDMTHSADVSGESDTTEDNESGVPEPVLLAETSQSSSTTSRTTDAGRDAKSEPQSSKVPGLFSIRCECVLENAVHSTHRPR